MAGLLARVRDGVGERGLKTVITDRLWGVVGVKRAIDLDMTWFRLDLTDPERPRIDLAEGLELRRAGDDDIHLVDQLPEAEEVSTFTRALVDERRRAGHTLWMVVSEDRLAFACWIFNGKAEVRGAPGDGPMMPEGTVMLEDSITSPDFRGRGIAPAAWTTIGTALAARGTQRVYTKVEKQNIPSTKAVIKAGFRDVGDMTVTGRPPSRLRFSVTPGTAADGGDHWLLGLRRP